MAEGNSSRSLLSRLTEGVRQGLSSVQAAFNRGLSIPTVRSLLQRVGLAPRPPASLEGLRTASGKSIDPVELERIRTERQEQIDAYREELPRLDAELEVINRRQQALLRQSEELRTLDPKLPIPQDLIATSLGRQRREYAYIVELYGTISHGTEAYSKTVTLATDQLLSSEEALSEALSLGVEYGAVISGGVLLQTYRRSELA